MKKLLLVLSVVAMASLLFTGCLPTTNTAPVFTSTPSETATVDTVYTYTPTATDADDDTVTFEVAGPTGMAISAGVITWTPTAVGTEAVVVTATDGTDPVTQSFTITVGAVPITPVAPTITDIPVQVVYWDEDGWTYQVEVTLGTGTTLTYSLIGAPISMSISSTGLITWTTILDMPALHEVTVKVVDNDGLPAEDIFVIEVTEPVAPLALTATIWYNPTHSYDGDFTYVRGYTALGDDVPVEVTLSEVLATGETLEIRWNDGTTTHGVWESLTLKTGETLVYEGTLRFNGSEWLDCDIICVEVQKIDEDFCPACDPVIILNDTVKVDFVAPELDLNIIFDTCAEGICPPVSSASFDFEPNTFGTCPEEDCCDEYCSGIDFWSIVNTDDCNPCIPSEGTGTCPAGTFACGCLIYASGDLDDPLTGVDEEDLTREYELLFTFADNVGNAIVDTWVITVDTDSVIGFANNQGDPAETNPSAVFTEGVYGTVNIPYNTCEVEVD